VYYLAKTVKDKTQDTKEYIEMMEEAADPKGKVDMTDE